MSNKITNQIGREILPIFILSNPINMQIKKEYKFYAGHRNQMLNDKCARPHGHDYRLFVVFSVYRKDNEAVTTLFDTFDSKIEPWLKENIDHRFLIDENDPLLKAFDTFEHETGTSLGVKVLPFATSVENVCHYLFHEIQLMGFHVDRIELQETRTSTIIYTKEDWWDDLLTWSPLSNNKVQWSI